MLLVLRSHHHPTPHRDLHQTIATADATAWGAQLHRTARAVAALLVLLYVIAADLVALTYRAGFELGRAVHQLNDRLAGIMPPVTLPPVLHPLAAMAAELEQLTSRELQAMAGTRRRTRKAELVAQLLVMP
ncbi:MAG: hypothetical protein EBR73_16545 [Rhodobacteraceae bacterium]|nr:hypothetical protein [Paracoccaceae bacterium]